MDHGLRDVEALLVVAHQAPPTDHPAEGPFNDPPPGDNLKAALLVRPAYALDGEVGERGFVNELGPAVGAISK